MMLGRKLSANCTNCSSLKPAETKHGISESMHMSVGVGWTP